MSDIFGEINESFDPDNDEYVFPFDCGQKCVRKLIVSYPEIPSRFIEDGDEKYVNVEDVKTVLDRLVDIYKSLSDHMPMDDSQRIAALAMLKYADTIKLALDNEKQHISPHIPDMIPSEWLDNGAS